MGLWPSEIFPLHIFPPSISFHSFFLPTSFPWHLSGIELLAFVSLSSLMASMNGWLLDRTFIVSSHSSSQNILCGLGSEVHPGNVSQANSQFWTPVFLFCCWTTLPPQNIVKQGGRCWHKGIEARVPVIKVLFLYSNAVRGMLYLGPESVGNWPCGYGSRGSNFDSPGQPLLGSAIGLNHKWWSCAIFSGPTVRRYRAALFGQPVVICGIHSPEVMASWGWVKLDGTLTYTAFLLL